MEHNKDTMDQAIENLISIHPLLSKNFTKAIRAKTNLNPGALHLLGALSHQGMMSMSEIGSRFSMHKPHVTGLVDKLIAESLVERLDDLNDRRIVNIRITENGEETFKSIKSEISQDLRQKLQLMEPGQIQTLYEASRQVREILTKLVVEQ